MELRLLHVIEATGAQLIEGTHELAVTGYSIDTRTLEPGDLFVAFEGEHADGNEYAAAALEKGAAACVLTRDPAPELRELAREKGAGLLVLRDGDSEHFLARLASYVRELMHTCICIGVTGSVGKTTTKEFIAAALQPQFRVCATEGNLNSLIGVSLSILRAPRDTQVLVLEMGMNHAGEIFQQTRVARPNLAVITNIGTSHIGNLGSRENIAHAKAEILQGIEPSPFVAGGGFKLFMPHEDDFASSIATQQAAYFGVDMYYAGLAAADDLRAENLQVDEAGYPHFEVCYPDGERLCGTLSILGAHAVVDAMLALAVADTLGVTRADAVAAVGDTAPYEMRLELMELAGGVRLINDCYNANPASMAAALDVLSELPAQGRRIAVLGEMGELGEREDELHALVGAYAAAKDLDLLVSVGGEHAAALREGALICGMSAERMVSYETPRSAAGALRAMFEPGDVVLVKASRAAGLDEFVREVGAA